MIQLINGEAIEEMKKIPDGSIDAVICDPPYGTTACKWDTVIPFEPMWEQLKRVTKKNGAIVLFGSQPFTSALVMSNVKMFKYEWVWEKSQGVNFAQCNHMPLKNTENIIVFGDFGMAKTAKIQPTYNPQGIVYVNRKKKAKTNTEHRRCNNNNDHIQKFENYPTQIIKFSSERSFHPTQKPVALMEYLIKTYTNEGETVLDFTMGSGTTLVAAKKLKRNGIGIELDKTYFDIAKKRVDDTIIDEATIDLFTSTLT